MKNSKLVLIFITILFAINNAMASQWTKASVVSYVRTYDGIKFSIGLKDVTCTNSKDYFYVNDRADNKTFSAIALASLTANRKVLINYDNQIDKTHCYVKGIWIVN